MAGSCLASFPVRFVSKNSKSINLFRPKSINLLRPSLSSSSLSSPSLLLSLSLSLHKTPSFLPNVASAEDLTVGGNWEDSSYPELPEDAKLFVGNLPYDIDSEKLALLFQKAGTVEVAEVIYKRETDQSRGFGFVTMSTVEEAEQAVEMFHRYDWNGRLLTVNKAAAKGSRPDSPPREFEPSFKIYVGNLSWQVDDAGLEQVFSEHGKVLSARVVYDRETGRSRGFGFVTVASKIELDDAIAALDGQSLDGRAIRVNAAEERPRRGSF